MIVLLQHDATPEAVREVLCRIQELGLDAQALDGPRGRAFEVVGEPVGKALALSGLPGVREILTRRTPLGGGEPLWPHVALRLAILFLLLLVLLVGLTAAFPVALGDRATAAAPEGGVEVEWYLRPLDGLRRLLPSGLAWVGGWLVLLFWAALFLWPYLERSDPGTPRGRRVLAGVQALGALLLLLALLFAGRVL